ncbi:ABC transporter permease [Kitasatospora sp. NPDC056731]|uniref:ABC transporter permease n=1 Tax=Kitasatospora sp. NPDC056731 TaxID=3155422 RepID=UPI0034470F54
MTRARPLIAVRFHLASLWNWRQVYYGRIIEPVAYLLFLAAGVSGAVGASGSGTAHHYLAFVLPGMLAMLAFRSGTAAVSDVSNDRKWGVFAFYRMYGGGTTGYLLSVLIVLGGVFLLQLLVVIGLAAPLGALSGLSGRGLLLTVAGSLLVDAGWVLAGAAVAAWIQSYATRDFVVTLTALPVVLAAPLFYPLDTAPGYLRFVARLDPLTYQVDWLRSTWAGSAADLLWAALWTLGTGALAVLALRAADHLTTER